MRALLLLAALGLSLSACASSDATRSGKRGANQGRSDGKVTVCHRGKTIRVNGNAVRAHLNHGDRRGACRR